MTPENGDPLKSILSRSLHSLYVHKENGNIRPITQFVFRAISRIIVTPQLFNRYGNQFESAEFVLREFQHQFYLETGFHNGMISLSDRPFDLHLDVTLVTPYLNQVEAAYPLLMRVSSRKILVWCQCD